MENIKTLIRSALVAAGLIIVSAGAANAQMPNALKFSTSFPFMVGHTSMPAGDYTVRPLDGDPALMELTNGHSSVLVLTERDAPRVAPRQDEVTFAKRGDTYVLREFWDASTLTGAETIEFHAAHAPHGAKAR